MPNVYVVTATALNLRSAPVVKPSTKLAMLPEGQVVRKIGDADDAEWWKVSADLNGARFEGYVKHQYLAAEAAAPESGTAPATAPEVHLTPKSAIRRSQSSGRAYPLNEDGQPRRSEVSATSLTRIVDWLAVETSARYLPGGGATFCNIYAYDYCSLAGVFLPRVWWMNAALEQLAAGENVQPLYDKTVHELNANSLHDWLGEYGPAFGWRRLATVDEVQNAANAGKAAVICAKRKDLNRSGHIVAVVPETGEHRAVRSAGLVSTPLQSQAGGTNFRYGTKRWWTNDKFSAFGFWAVQ
jgi:hypothetical protein